MGACVGPGSVPLWLLWQGVALLAFCDCAWLWAAARRKRARLSWACESQSSPAAARPTVTAVLPVTGSSPDKLRNLRSQLRSHYGGTLHVVFSVESEEDAAVRPNSLSALVRPHAPTQHAVALQLCSELPTSPLRCASVVVAGLAQRRSQKIHNQLAGVAAAPLDTQLFLFLDDDAWVHASTLDALVSALEREPGALMVTGYPFEVPPLRASFWALCIMAYHLPLLVAFSHGRVTRNVWGGCMLLSAAHFREGGCVARAWGEDGAYSDDLILAALAQERRQTILCPAAAIFPTALPRACSATQAWNYLRRQTYVLDTYVSETNRRVNHTLMAIGVYAAAAMLAAVATAVATVLTLLLGDTAACAGSSAPLGALMLSGMLCVAARALRRLYGELYAACVLLSPDWVAPCALEGIPWARVLLALLAQQAAMLACALRMVLSSRVVWARTEYGRVEGRVTVLRRATDTRH